MRTSFTSFLLIICYSVHAQIDLIPVNNYICSFTENSLTIDGLAKEDAWQKAPWTESFININDIGAEPNLNTQVKMLWDHEYFYFYAQMEEPHIWAKITQRDEVIFYDNDIEIFIDPDGDTHQYYELELNALNTAWDLLLTKPYRDGGRAIDSWDINGLKSAVQIEGTLNDPSDTDSYWSIEVAIPWKVLEEAHNKRGAPEEGDIWRINYSRVQWLTEIKDGNYIKRVDENGKRLPEQNWVWSRQRAIAMHEPEFWGRVIFTSNPSKIDTSSFNESAEEVRQLLYTIHRNQIQHRKKHKTFSNDKALLLPYAQYIDGASINWILSLDGRRYHAIIKEPGSSNTYWHIDESGRNWKEIK